MMALFPRDENVCTKIQIHVQLRRCAPQEGKVSLKVVRLDAEGRVDGTERESRPIPMEGGHADVRKEMQELLELEHGRVHDAGQHVCTTRAIVLEIESPNVPSIDLVDMPGLNSYGHKETTTLLDRHHQVHGAKSMYLLVIDANVRPVNDLGGQFIINNDLQYKTCGVFTQTDELKSRNLGRLQNWVVSSDAATAPASQEDANMAASEAASLGSIPLKPYGWLVTSNKPPTLPTDASSFQRLSQQAEDEISLFRDNQPVDSTGILKALFNSGHATSGALITQLSKMYSTFLNDTWAPSTFMQIDEQISVLNYEVAMLGSPGDQEVEEAVGAEVDLRLNKYLPSYYVTFNAEVVLPYNKQCQELIMQLTSMSAEAHEHAVEFIARLEVEKQRVHNELKSATDNMAANVRTFWAEAFTDILTARYSLDEESLKYVMKVNDTEPEGTQFRVGDDASTLPQAKVFASFSYFIDKMFATKKQAMDSATAQPPFQLAEYPELIKSIKSTLDAKLMLRMNDTKYMVYDMIDLVDYVNTSTRSTPLLSLAFQEDLTQASVTTHENLSFDFCVALLKHTPCMKDMLNVRSEGTGIRVGNEQISSFDNREEITRQIKELHTARKEILVALEWDEERLREATKSMSAGDQEAARNAAAAASKKSVTKSKLTKKERREWAKNQAKGKRSMPTKPLPGPTVSGPLKEASNAELKMIKELEAAGFLPDV